MTANSTYREADREFDGLEGGGNEGKGYGVKPDNSPVGYRCENDEAGERGGTSPDLLFGNRRRS